MGWRWIILLWWGASLPGAGGLDIATRALPRAIVGRSYHAVIEVAGGGYCTWNHPRLRVEAGEMPEGVELSGAGYLTGSAAAEGVYRFRVRADTECQSAARELALVVTGAPLLHVSEPEAAFLVKAGGAPEEKLLRVHATWPSLAYSVEVENGPWLEAEPQRGETPREGAAMAADLVRLRVKPEKLAPGRYEAVLKVNAWDAANQPRVRVRLEVVP